MTADSRPDAVRTLAGADGISGEYRPEPVELEVPRLRASGRGTAGIASSGEMTHHEHLQAVREGRLGSMHSWELVTGVDGPGTRMTVFLAGCPLRCLYCHNPDTLFTAKGEPVLLEDLVARLKRYRGIFRATKGGLTVSGGEPLQQPAFLARLLAEAKAMDIHTCIDTSGFLGANCTDEMLGNLDLVLLDIKSGLPETYRRVTGRELQPTLDFSRRLSEAGTEIWLRFVCVPGLTDAEENVAAVAEHVATLGTVSRVEVLPFHQMGRDKWAGLGMTYQLGDVPPPTPETLERVRGQFRAHGLTTW
ncbi:pyruvate formate-lyase-activating protein [Luteococcus sp. H138]|uniref:pyruvate formate-lyase-activating protein n=1 Tax=unclassified Luteococcus TaxID=2639923 RepID=UPI00313E8F69